MSKGRSPAIDMTAERREAQMRRILAAVAALAAMVLGGGAGISGL